MDWKEKYPMIWAAAIFGMTSLAHADSGNVAAQSADLVTSPGSSQVKLKLPQNAPVKITGRQGAWYSVESGTVKGWLRMLTVAIQPTPVNHAPDATHAAGINHEVTATMGVRGLGEEKDRTRTGNAQAVKAMESYVPTANAMQKFATAGRLAHREAPLPAASSGGGQDIPASSNVFGIGGN